MKELGFKIEDEVITVTSQCYINGKKTDVGKTFTKDELRKGIFVRHLQENRIIRIRIVTDNGGMELFEFSFLHASISWLPTWAFYMITDKVIEIFQIPCTRIGPLPKSIVLKWGFMMEGSLVEKLSHEIIAWK
jgi:hypothetical protein